ncbi:MULTISPECIES: ATP-binding cassette domain-containing protein [Moraxella]|uniref:YbbL ABC transporter ATP-binding protein n=1 Tax=Moraxella catarrhalis TaxID=480 RepID=A0A7Z0V0G2_MORCA|nr:ATP-binding cassette domain-containing protein [Moraxella catarrhalis]OAV02166.1 YbbL ABC transporter ATP-binding protein [Moraxella catarrhalis]STY81941.1 Uncharacterized ABC transporter ATP-binding protein YbbL [Moraxella catarrhalis]
MALFIFDRLNIHISTPDQTRTLLHQAKGSINAGQKIILMGASGSGKSLFLSALAGQLPHEGDAVLNLPNQTLSCSSDPLLWREKVALITQTPVMIAETVMDNLKLPLTFKQHQDKVFDQNWHISQLSRFGKTAEFLNQNIHTLSGGERQIVHFMRTLQLNPALLLLDEPTAALDENTAAKLIDCVNDWVSDQPDRAVIWVSHQPHHAMALSAISWWIKDGVLITERSKL